MPRPSHRSGLGVLCLMTALVVAGCSGDDGPELSAEPSRGTQSATASASESGGAPTDGPTDDALDEPSDDEVLGTKDASVGGQPVLFEVVALRRDGDLAFLDLRLTNRGAESAGLVGGVFGTGVLDNTISGVSLVDGTNRTRHVPVRDDQDRCLCSRTLTSVQPGASIALTATYAAPPDDVDRITVDVPSVGTFDVPISG